jgi:hypothetical protein
MSLTEWKGYEPDEVCRRCHAKPKERFDMNFGSQVNYYLPRRKPSMAVGRSHRRLLLCNNCILQLDGIIDKFLTGSYES